MDDFRPRDDPSHDDDRPHRDDAPLHGALGATLRAELSVGKVSPDRADLLWRLRSINPLRLLLTLLLIALIALGVFFAVGPGRPTLEHFLAAMAERTPRPTKTALASATVEASAEAEGTKELAPPSATSPPSSGSTPTRRSSPTLAATDAPTDLPASESDCNDALSVTLADLGKTLCVQGTILNITKQAGAFLVTFDRRSDAFYLVSYDLEWKQAVPGTCIQITGEIKQLGNAPVIVFGYNNLPEVCP